MRHASVEARWLPSIVPALLAMAACLGVAASAPALTITVTGGQGRSSADDGSGSQVQVLQPLASPPFASGPVTAIDGGSVSTTRYTLTSSFFLWEFDHTRTANGGAALSDDFGSPGPLNFTVDQDVLATITGTYSVTDTGSGDRVVFEGIVRDVTNAGQTVHATSLESRTTQNETLTIGVAGGDHSNTVVGSTTFLLEAGILYDVNWFALVQDLRADPGDTGATASGFLRIAFVPEPRTVLLLGLGLAGLGSSRRRAGRRRRPHVPGFEGARPPDPL